jgi:hypothetical protein
MTMILSPSVPPLGYMSNLQPTTRLRRFLVGGLLVGTVTGPAKKEEEEAGQKKDDSSLSIIHFKVRVNTQGPHG